MVITEGRPIAGSVLAPLIFNVYTNDQHIHPGTRSFVYADDLASNTQSEDFAPNIRRAVASSIRNGHGKLRTKATYSMDISEWCHT